MQAKKQASRRRVAVTIGLTVIAVGAVAYIFVHERRTFQGFTKELTQLRWVG
jgi:hypothetical protein